MTSMQSKTSAQSSQSQIEAPAPGTYRVEPESSKVTFTTRHVFGLGGVAGSFGISSGEVVIADDLPASSVVASADVASFDTGSAARDREVRSKKFLDAASYPSIDFRSDGLTQQDGGWVVRGVLSARGKDAPLELAITKSEVDGDAWAIEAVGTVDRYAHDITAMKGMAGRHLRLTVTARARRI